ncbi:hypothetical protein OIU76_007986 [Salix suchowensis]|nr:hypothetical protein OIU76_007986 [Salix suchowensis]
MSVSEEIHLQLNNIESQIQKDLVKLSSVSKSKRKRLESRFEGDRSCYLPSPSLLPLPSEGTVKKQKSSHQKLLMQAEETVKTQLNDAQRRITAVHKMAREKTLQLKHVVAECLNEGVLS